MGYGEFGGGGSVSWKVEHEENNKGQTNHSAGKADGHDTIPVAEMGKKKQAPDGHFRVEVMYHSPSDAQAAQQSVVVQGSSLVFYVKANSGQGANNAGGHENYPPQIRVSW